MTEFDLEHPPWSEEAGGTGRSDDWGDEQDRSEWFEAAADHYATRAAELERQLAQPRFVYLIDRDGEIDVYADLDDANEASEILVDNADEVPYNVVEQVIFEPSAREPTTRKWLDELRRDTEGYADIRN